MVVEDEVLVRMVLADQIREAGYRVIEASNADEALELLRHGSLDLKVAVTDIHMLGSTDGLEMSRLIKRIFPLAKIVIVSGTHGALDGVSCDAFFLKP